MKSPFPVPSSKYFPEELSGDQEGAALADAIDRELLGVQSDLIGLRDLFSPEACPVQLLDDLAAMVKADTNPGDSVSMKRRKIATAIKGHKSRSLWIPSVKSAIDAIVVPMGSTGCYKYGDSNAWLLRGNVDFDPVGYASSLGDDGIDHGLGIKMIGEGSELEIAGNIYIALGYANMTPTQLVFLIDSIKDDLIPAYFRIVMGYVSTATDKAHMPDDPKAVAYKWTKWNGANGFHIFKDDGIAAEIITDIDTIRWEVKERYTGLSPVINLSTPDISFSYKYAMFEIKVSRVFDTIQLLGDTGSGYDTMDDYAPLITEPNTYYVAATGCDEDLVALLVSVASNDGFYPGDYLQIKWFYIGIQSWLDGFVPYPDGQIG